jgi:hypothetical protein
MKAKRSQVPDVATASSAVPIEQNWVRSANFVKLRSLENITALFYEMEPTRRQTALPMSPTLIALQCR